MITTTITSILNRLDEGTIGTAKEYYTNAELEDFATFYLDKWDENTSEDVISESLVDFFYDTKKQCRRCTECGKIMIEGYCYNNGENYYCSDECKKYDFSDEEWNNECEENDQSYFTNWR